MKKLFILLIAFGLSLSCMAQKSYEELKSIGYQSINTEKFEEIQKAVYDQDDWNPIVLVGYSKSELVAFYTQKYDDDSIKDWIDWAYEKMEDYSPPSADQDIEFRKILDLPRTRENMYYFMMIMTIDQISTVGY